MFLHGGKRGKPVGLRVLEALSDPFVEDQKPVLLHDGRELAKMLPLLFREVVRDERVEDDVERARREKFRQPLDASMVEGDAFAESRAGRACTCGADRGTIGVDADDM